MKTILIIEDEKGLRDLLGKALDHEGFQILTAENGKEGVKLAEEQHPDLILSDIQMYPTNGYETLEKIRKLPSNRSIPFILMTAEPSFEGMR
ncbi:MAG TPA: response regulator [Verrucomicrobiales bacterium]|nr:response regulator [Verrucomicrobiales bacterium]